MSLRGDLASFYKLVDELRRWPTISYRNAVRIAVWLVRKDVQDIGVTSRLLDQAKQQVSLCPTCKGLTELEICFFCKDETRSSKKLCVVASWLDFFAIKDSATSFDGKYFILGGVLSPLEGIMIQDLFIDSLVERFLNEPLEEIVFALSPTPEGEATISCILSLFEEKNKAIGKVLSFYRIASGLPVGANLEYADRSTITQAFSEKRPL